MPPALLAAVTSTKRDSGLDTLRGVALLMVMIAHSVAYPAAWGTLGHRISMTLKSGGWAGVDLFFVLSGFLVGGLLFREHLAEGKIDFPRFFARRGFKIYPLFWVTLGFIISWKTWMDEDVTNTRILAELFFFQNYVTGVWGTNWSLGVEEHFYLLLPAILAFLAWRNRGRPQPFVHFPRIVLAVALFCFTARALTWHFLPYDNLTHLTPTHLRIDGLFFGVLLAYYQTSAPDRFDGFCRRYRYFLLVGGILAFVPAFGWVPLASMQMQVFGLTLHYLGGGALVCAARGARPGRWPNPLAWVGRYSYAAYLIHFWVGNEGIWQLHWFRGIDYPTYLALYFGFTLLGAWLLTVSVEGPFLQLRERYFPARGRKSAPLLPAGELAAQPV